MKYPLILLSIFAGVFIWSVINPHDYLTWFLEVFPTIIGLFILIFTYKKFRFTNFVYVLILIQAIILCVGGHYTYERVPLFDWIRDLLGHERNNFDKVGHFFQGFVPVFIAREIFIRQSIITEMRWLNFISVNLCISLSALYEIFEWWVGELAGSAGDSFLGTQGYIWDAQSDILFAAIGATIGVIFFSKIHDQAIEKQGF